MRYVNVCSTMTKINPFMSLICLLSISLVACAKQSAPTLAETELSISASSLVFSEKDSAQSVRISTNAGNYEIVVPSGITWCNIQKTGNDLRIAVSGMTSALSQRNTVVTVIAGSGSQKVEKTITVSQSRVWKLVWEDDFNTDGPVSSEKWTLVTKGTPDWKKYMTPSDELAFVQGGNLILKARKTATSYETSGITSANKYHFKYGKVEVRAKLCAGQGTWPAIWMMPQQSVYGGWPKSGEIDIMEHLNHETKVWQVIHSHYVDNLGIKNDPPYSSTAPFTVGSFNTYGIEWFPERIDFLVNGAVTFSYPKKANLPADQLQWPFDQSFHLILNLALGGSWVGAINDAILPVQSEIDYVKVFELAQY